MKTSLFLFFLLFSVTLFAEEYSGQFNDLLKEHTVTINLEDDNNAEYVYGMRRLFIKIVKFGETYGLSKDDVSIIREIGIPKHNTDVIKPYFDELSIRIGGPDDVVDLARLLVQASEAESQADAEFYLSAFHKLSAQGQEILINAYLAETENVEITKTDYESLAAADPGKMRAWLNSMVNNYHRKLENAHLDQEPNENGDQDNEDSSSDFGLSKGGGQ